jgi:hypothetical protein
VSNPAKILLGLATLWPYLYLLIFVLVLMPLFVYRMATAPAPAYQSQTLADEPWTKQEIALMVAHGGTALLLVGLVTFYAYHVTKNPYIEKAQKNMALFRGSGMLTYWYRHIWLADDRAPSRSQPS